MRAESPYFAKLLAEARAEVLRGGRPRPTPRRGARAN